MCDRFTLGAPELLAIELEVPEAFPFPPRFNIAPTQLSDAVTLKPTGESCGMVQLP